MPIRSNLRVETDAPVHQELTPMQPETVLKRDGRRESFDARKIYSAALRAFGRPEMADAAKAEGATRVAEAVTNILTHRNGNSPHGPGVAEIEEIQDLVVSQLFALGYPVIAEHYRAYREERRRQREERPIPAHVQAAFADDDQYLKDPMQKFQFYDKYSRWKEEEGRRETWAEAVDRSIVFLTNAVVRNAGAHKAALVPWERLRQAMLKQEAFPSMRLFQMAGPAAERENACCYNCAYTPMDGIQAHKELLYLLGSGCGVGFSVEPQYIEKYPRVKRQTGKKPSTVIVADSLEGWCEALEIGMREWFAGRDVLFDTHLLREAGERLKTKGGRASGPDPLKLLLKAAREIILAKQGSFLEDIDVHDIACHEGMIIHMGGVRRAALISLSALGSQKMRYAKSGNWYDRHGHRRMANNSASYTAPPTATEFMAEWLALAESGSGERGIFTRYAIPGLIPSRRRASNRKTVWGVNPCAEILLRPHGFCNLSIAIARAHDTQESLIEKVELATLLGTIQSMLTDFGPMLSPAWKKNAEEERLLGVDIMGQCDCPLLQPGNDSRWFLLQGLKNVVRRTNEKWADVFGIQVSAATTCGKPGGNSSQLFSAASGISPREARFIIRRVRSGAHNPVARMLKEIGVPWYPEVGETRENHSVCVFEFPVEAPAGSTLKKDLPAMAQLEYWKETRENWAEHSISASIYIGKDEWFKAGAWVFDRLNMMGSLSFFPRDEHVYQLAPNEEITEEEYRRRVDAFPDLTFSKLLRYEFEDETTVATELACASGQCEL